jgi:hypothetical protein
MPVLGAPLDFAKYEARNLRTHNLGSAPSTPLTGQMYYSTADNTLWWWDGTQWVSARGGAASVPPATTTTQGTIQLAGDLAGTATSPQIAPGVITDVDVAASNKDGAAGTPSLRTLGTGSTQAAAGNDVRFADSRPPSGAASGDLTGTYPSPQIAAGVIVDADVAAANKDGAVGTPSLRTIGTGAQQAMAGNTRLDTIAAPTGPVNHANQKITNLADPTAATDGATKQYVDNTVQGLNAKAAVFTATTANITLSGPQSIDSTAVVQGQRVLVKNQTTASQNGIYICQSAAWTRAPDANTWAELASAYVWVETGTANADTGWLCTVDAGFGTIESTAVTWVQFSGAGQITSGAGLTKTGNTLDVGQGAGITVNADSIQVATGGVTDAMLATPKAGYYSSATHGAGATITITQATHGCRATKGLLVQVQDEASGAVEWPDVVVAASGQVTVTYGASVVANSKRVTVIG